MSQFGKLRLAYNKEVINETNVTDSHIFAFRVKRQQENCISEEVGAKNCGLMERFS